MDQDAFWYQWQKLILERTRAVIKHVSPLQPQGASVVWRCLQGSDPSRLCPVLVGGLRPLGWDPPGMRGPL